MLLPDVDTCLRAVRSRDRRFDGWFYTGVSSTGIYCRPSCPAITPLRRNVGFYPSAAAAQLAGFRACKRCRPDTAPGSPEWDVRDDVTGRALRLIADGVIERDGVPGLARRLGYSTRQLHRTLHAAVGAGPLALARAQRAQTARTLLESTNLAVTDVAFAAGFGSVRQFNDTVQAVFAASPSEIRRAVPRRAAPERSASSVTLRLPYREPMDVAAVLDFLGAHAVEGLEDYRDGVFTRVLRGAHGPAVIALSAEPGAVRAQVRLDDLSDLTTVVARIRRLLDLDADPLAVCDALQRDPRLEPLIARRPGLRSPGAVNGFETAVRTIVGQQVSLRGARRVLARILIDFGSPAFGDESWLLFPEPEALARAEPDQLPMPRARARAVIALARAQRDGAVCLDAGARRTDTMSALLALPGIGPWTADYLRMRALGDPDVLLASDLVVRRAAERLGLHLAGGRPDWAPWRSYVTHHLWAHLYADLWSAQR